jgi:malonyl CoA-acyl carrier protein transacylase
MEELTSLGGTAVSHLFWLGLRVAEATQRDGGDDGDGGSDGGTWALGVAKVAPEALSTALAAHQLNSGEPGRLALVVRNGPAASVVSGQPTDLAAFAAWLRVEAEREGELKGACVRALPVKAPFHHAALLGEVPRAVSLDVERRALPTLRAFQLRTPLVSCVDGGDLRGSGAGAGGDLMQQVVEGVCVRPVDWPTALASLLQLAPRGGGAGVDFGPGGGCGALQLARHAASSQLEAVGIEACYFSQILEPGPLPGSWLRWSA